MIDKHSAYHHHWRLPLGGSSDALLGVWGRGLKSFWILKNIWRTFFFFFLLMISRSLDNWLLSNICIVSSIPPQTSRANHNHTPSSRQKQTNIACSACAHEQAPWKLPLKGFEWNANGFHCALAILLRQLLRISGANPAELPLFTTKYPFCPKCKNKLSNILALKSLYYSKLKISFHCYLHGRWLEMTMKHDLGNFTSTYEADSNGVEGVVCTSSSST